jgi:thioredoxin-dependent peroxiredoxin
MGHIREIYSEFEQRDARVVTILAESLQRMQRFLEKNQYPFPVLSDVRRTVSRAYGVYVKVNFESVNIARPAQFVVDGNGIISYIYVGRTQADFPRDEELFDVLDRLES